MAEGSGGAGLRAGGAVLLVAGFGTALAGAAFNEAGEALPPVFLLPLAFVVAIAGGVMSALARRAGGPPAPSTARINDGLVLLGIAAGLGAVACAGLAAWLAGARGVWCVTEDDVCGGTSALLAGFASVLGLPLAVVGAGMLERGRQELDRLRKSV